ncbi:hypothetical protein AB0I24_07185 [Brachybacterium paraconglomeratum]
MTSVRGTSSGVELRQGNQRIALHRQQALAFTNYIVDWTEYLERREQEQQ